MEEEEDHQTTTIKLHLASSSSSSSSSSSTPPFSLQLPSLESGVDLVVVGDALGLDPPTVRLNGHFLSRGGDGVSAVTWRTLLSFFSSRGFPTGADGEPIQVQGKPLLQGTRHEICGRNGVRNFNNFHKRKYFMDDENPPNKKKSAQCDQNRLQDSSDLVSDSNNALCLKRKLRLDDEIPLQKRKTTEDVASSVDIIIIFTINIIYSLQFLY